MLVDDLGGKLIDLEHVAILDQNDVVVVVAGDVIFDEFLLPKQHAVFAVDRHDEFRP